MRSGLPGPTHYMSAHDIATLSRVIIRDYPEYYKYYSIREFEWNGIKQQNRNGLLAGTRASTASRPATPRARATAWRARPSAASMRLISVVLGTQGFKAREDASATLLNYGFTFFETIKAKGAGDVVLKPEVYKGEEDRVTLVPAHDVFVTIGRGVGRAAQDRRHGEGAAHRTHQGRPGAGRAHGERWQPPSSRACRWSRKEAVPEGGWWTRMVDGISLWMK